MRRIAAILAGFVMLLATPGLAVQPDEVLADPALEARAREISAGLRCLVCQNQSIDDSDADLARDLRLLVRERLVAGDSDEAVQQYVVDRYGEFVLLQPVLAPHTLVLWVAAPLLLIAGLTGLFIAARRRSGPPAAGITAEERDALATLEAEAGEP